MDRDASAAEINEQMIKIDQIEIGIKEASKAVAWRNKGDAQVQYLVVCEYADEWINYGGYRIRSYYLYVCGVMIASKLWPRLHLQLDVTSQRHYG
jgi:hypothetical protein